MGAPQERRSTDQPSRAALVLHTACVALACALAWRLGSPLSTPPPAAHPVFPASGIALAALLLGGPRLVGGVWLGCFLAALPPLLASVGPFTASACAAQLGLVTACQALLARRLLCRLADASSPFASPLAAATFLAVALGCSLLGAAVGTVCLGLAALLGGHDLGATWLGWLLGDACGVLVAGPLILA